MGFIEQVQANQVPGYQIPGTESIDSLTSAANDAKAAVESKAPTFNSMLDSIKNGTVFKDVSARIASIGSLPGAPNVANAQAVVAKAQNDLTANLAIANATIAQKAKMAQAAGTTLSQAEIAATNNIFKVNLEMTSVVDNVMSQAKSAVGSAASAFGASVPSDPLAAVNAIGTQCNAFAATIPVDPGPSDPQAQAAYLLNKSAFDAVPGNLAKQSAVTNLTSAGGTLANALNIGLTGLAAISAAARGDSIALLKADIKLASLTKSVAPVAKAAVEATVDSSKIDKYVAIKAQEKPVAAPIPSENKPEPDPIRPSNASIIKEIPAFGEAPGANKSIWKYEVAQEGLRRDAAQATYRAGFGATVKMSQAEADAKAEEWVASLFKRVLGEEANTLRLQSVAIRNAKGTDPANYTPEEADIRTRAKANAALVKADPEYILAKETNWENLKAAEADYKELFNNWIGPNDRFKLNAALLERIGTYKS